MAEDLHITKVVVLFFYFVILGYLFLQFLPGLYLWPVLVLGAVCWFLLERNEAKKEEIQLAFSIGLFLMFFDFIVENLGGVLGYWQVTTTLLHVGYVPIEVMLLTLIGGTAWALAQPKNFSFWESAADVLLFSIFGAVGEFVLMQNNVMFYANGWTSAHAFLGYFIMWVILHYLRYSLKEPFFKFKM